MGGITGERETSRPPCNQPKSRPPTPPPLQGGSKIKSAFIRVKTIVLYLRAFVVNPLIRGYLIVNGLVASRNASSGFVTDWPGAKNPAITW